MSPRASLTRGHFIVPLSYSRGKSTHVRVTFFFTYFEGKLARSRHRVRVWNVKKHTEKASRRLQKKISHIFIFSSLSRLTQWKIFQNKILRFVRLYDRIFFSVLLGFLHETSSSCEQTGNLLIIIPWAAYKFLLIRNNDESRQLS